MSIIGKQNPGVLNEEANRVTAARMKESYSSIEFTAGAPLVDQSIKALYPTKFTAEPQKHTMVIRTSADIIVKLNSAANDGISVSALEGSFSIDALEVSDIFLTAPNGAVIKILLI